MKKLITIICFLFISLVTFSQEEYQGINIEIEEYKLQDQLLYKKVLDPDPYLEALEKVRIYQEARQRNLGPNINSSNNNIQDNSVNVQGNNNQVIYNNNNNPVLQPLNPKPL